MLRLVPEGEPPAAADTDFAFLGDSEEVPVGELRTVLHTGRPPGAIELSEPRDSISAIKAHQ